jgi:hypothetical protein
LLLYRDGKKDLPVKGDREVGKTPDPEMLGKDSLLLFEGSVGRAKCVLSEHGSIKPDPTEEV